MIPPQAALFDPGEAVSGLPVCDHYAGVEARMAKSLALQAELGPVFDVTLDCEDGAPVGAEAAHADLVTAMVLSPANVHGRCGVRVHPVGHPSFAADVAIDGDRIAAVGDLWADMRKRRYSIVRKTTKLTAAKSR